MPENKIIFWIDWFPSHDRLGINFGTSVMQLPGSCMIDALETSLKRNAYKVNMHLPNSDSDQLAVETNQFKK